VKARVLKNIVGAQVRRLRCQKNWSQERLAEELQDIGWNVGRKRIAKIEGGEARVSSLEHLVLARVFAVGMEALLPRMEASQSFFIFLQRQTCGGFKTLMPPEEIIACKTAKLLNGTKINGH
jgi:transcriptional regulator with XRE-family HTH domain